MSSFQVGWGCNYQHPDREKDELSFCVIHSCGPSRPWRPSFLLVRPSEQPGALD